MALFGFSTETVPGPVLRGNGLVLRAPRVEDYEAWSSLRRASRTFLAPWEPVWTEDDLTRRAFRARVKRAAADIEADEAYAMLIFRATNMELLGGLTIGLVRRGVAQACTLGYWAGEAHAGQGHMSRAVHLAAHHVFTDLGLRRIEAACLPRNQRSRRLLERVGFQREGYARQYLCIAGRWEDHLLYALLPDDLRPPSPRGEPAPAPAILAGTAPAETPVTPPTEAPTPAPFRQHPRPHALPSP